ncbi:MAG: amino acid synthesis family protein [Bradyrhizobiaceae bacterium]|nr:amino acid synthesis family protein [Bradyrhizobiaceae bacterium]
MKLRTRKWYSFVEHEDGCAGEVQGVPLRKVAVAAIVENPYANRQVTDLSPLIDASEELGREMSKLLVSVLGPYEVQSYGKAGIAGLAGEQEHANALLTTKFADPLRQAVGGGKAWISSFTKRATAGVPIDIPLACKDALYVRSHYDGMTILLPDAPLPNEIAVIFCVANRGRIHARVGGLKYEDKKGEDGLF